MKIINVTTVEELEELSDVWAMTWEGLSEASFEDALRECCEDGVNGTGYVIKGKVMNEICHLTGNNSYPDDLNIFAIKNYKGIAMYVGARWMYDIIANNGRREGYLPFELK